MPDRDRFERKLRKGWRKVYRLGCSGASIEAVADRVMRTLAHVLRTEPTACLLGIFVKLKEAVNFLEGPLFRESASRAAFQRLASEVGEIAAGETYSEMSRLGGEAARQTFNEVDLAGHVLGDDALGERFVWNLAWRVVERRCLSAGRDGIMQKTGRDSGAQQRWEANLKESISAPCFTLSSGLLAEDGKRLIRAPKALFKPAPTTLETLSQPLNVMGESR